MPSWVQKSLPGTRIACCNQLHDRNLGRKCKSASDVLSSEHKSRILNGARSFYGASLRQLLKKFPLENIILRCCEVLHPDSHTSDSYLWGIRILCKKLNAISVNFDKLTNEWNQYCLEDIKEEWYHSNDGKPLRVDYYWSKIELIKDGMDHTKYPTIFSVVKAAFSLAHGNFEVERRFSDSGKTVTVDRTRLSEASINNL